MALWALHIIYHWSFKLPSHTSHFDVKRRQLCRPPLIILFTQRCLQANPHNLWTRFFPNMAQVTLHTWWGQFSSQSSYKTRELFPAAATGRWTYEDGRRVREATLGTLNMEKEDNGPRNVNSLSKLEKARSFYLIFKKLKFKFIFLIFN